MKTAVNIDGNDFIVEGTPDEIFNFIKNVQKLNKDILTKTSEFENLEHFQELLKIKQEYICEDVAQALNELSVKLDKEINSQIEDSQLLKGLLRAKELLKETQEDWKA